jgi:epoxyqueuosine reductase QueG
MMEKIALRLKDIFAKHRCRIFGYADLAGLVPAYLGLFDQAVSFGLAMDPKIMAGVEAGPTRSYAALYSHVNRRLDSLAGLIVSAIGEAGGRALAIPASLRSDAVNLKGDFPHKTAATRAGLGWIGKNAQLVTESVGPWLRLSTVLTDMPLPVGNPVEKSSCGKCDRCVAACPARALSDVEWIAGQARHELIDVQTCDQYKKAHFFAYNQGNSCGICTAACPLGQKTLKRR